MAKVWRFFSRSPLPLRRLAMRLLPQFRMTRVQIRKKNIIALRSSGPAHTIK
jgi:hypothetical protein